MAALIIAGSGPVGMRAAAEIARRLPQLPCLLYGEEPCEPYDRSRLSAFVAGELSREALRATDLADAPQVGRHYGCAVRSIDRAGRCITDAAGQVRPYSKLILATGARGHYPKLPGMHLEGVHPFRDLGDAERLIARRMRSRRTLVLGGGLLGIEAARAMRRHRTEVTLVEHAPRLMPRQLDSHAAALLQRRLEQEGIQVVLGSGVRLLFGDTRVAGARLMNGEDLCCDTIVLATGTRPRTELALQAGLPVGAGIRVDDRLRTADPDIFAIGECAEHRGTVYRMAAPGLEQAATVAAVIAGEDVRYTGSGAGLSATLCGLPVFSSGRVGEDELGPDDDTKAFMGREGYCKVVLTRGRMAGALAVGTGFDVARLQRAVRDGWRPAPWQRWRFLMTGQLWAEAPQAVRI